MMCVVYFTKNAIFDDFMALESLLNHVVDPKPIDIKNNCSNKNKYFFFEIHLNIDLKHLELCKPSNIFLSVASCLIKSTIINNIGS